MIALGVCLVFVLGVVCWKHFFGDGWTNSIVPPAVGAARLVAAASDMSGDIGPGGNGDRLAIFSLASDWRKGLAVDAAKAWHPCPLDEDPDAIETVFWARALSVQRAWTDAQEALLEELKAKLRTPGCIYNRFSAFKLVAIIEAGAERTPYLLYVQHF